MRGGFAAGAIAASADRHSWPAAGRWASSATKRSFPAQSFKVVSDRQFLVNVTNDGWFGNTTGPRQHFHQARVRAVEEGVPLVRAANNGISAVIDAKAGCWPAWVSNVRGVVDHAVARGTADAALCVVRRLRSFRCSQRQCCHFCVGAAVNNVIAPVDAVDAPKVDAWAAHAPRNVQNA